VVATYPKGKDLNGKSVAAIADRVLPALTEAMSLLQDRAPEEAANFRGSVLTAIEAAVHDTKPSPVVTDMISKITKALDAA